MPFSTLAQKFDRPVSMVATPSIIACSDFLNGHVAILSPSVSFLFCLVKMQQCDGRSQPIPICSITASLVNLEGC